MLTFLTIPKPFRGRIGAIQRNALRSWSMLRPACHIILFGDEDGTAEAAAEFDAGHVPDVALTEFGTPLLNDLFKRAPRLADTPLLCYANADIILMDDFMRAAGAVNRLKRPFLMIGQRRDLDVSQPLDFTPGWEEKLRARALREGRLLGPIGIDYFLFPRGLWRDIPPFAVGRPGWDNWMLWKGRSMGARLIDATPSVMAVHQKHDYGHHPDGKQGLWQGPEAQRNRELAGKVASRFSVDDATHLLTSKGVKRALDRWHMYRYIKTLPVFHPFLLLPSRLLLAAIDFSQPLRTRLGLRLRSGEEYRR